MSDTDFLSEENFTTPEAVAQTVEAPGFEAPSWEDIKSGKISYKELPNNIKSKVKQEAYEETPEEKKYLWDDYGYTPPETYNGVDKNGNPVQAYGLDGFEDLVKKGRIKPKTKIELDVENLTRLVKDQNKTILSQRESDIEKKLAEAKENALSGSDQHFAEYEKLLSEKQDVKFQKLQLENKNVTQEQPKEATDYSQQYSLDEQVAIKIFGEAEENKPFVNLMAKSSEMQRYFDQVGRELYERNRNATPEQILAATKKLTETRFNLNKQQQRPMFRNTIQTEQKTNLQSAPTQKINYSSLTDRDKKWINSEARSGKAKYSGRSLDEITNMVYGHLLKK